MTRQLVRRSLDRADYARCVLLPKTEWSLVPAAGRMEVLVDGEPFSVDLAVEQCDCRGTGLHEHRYLLLPAGIGGDVVRIGLPDR